VKENKNIFQVAIDLNVDVAEFKSASKKMLELNPDWHYTLLTEKREMDNFMLSNFGKSEKKFHKEIYKTYLEIPRIMSEHFIDTGCDAREIVRISKLVAQIDFYKVCSVYTFGGLWMDVDTELRGRLDSFQEKSLDGVFFLNSRSDLGNSIFYAKKEHPFLKIVIDEIIFSINVRRWSNLVLAVGTDAWTRAALYASNNLATPKAKEDLLKPTENQISMIPRLRRIDGYTMRILRPIQINNKILDGDFLTLVPWKSKLHGDYRDENRKYNPHWLFGYVGDFEKTEYKDRI